MSLNSIEFKKLYSYKNEELQEDFEYLIEFLSKAKKNTETWKKKWICVSKNSLAIPKNYENLQNNGQHPRNRSSFKEFSKNSRKFLMLWYTRNMCMTLAYCTYIIFQHYLLKRNWSVLENMYKDWFVFSLGTTTAFYQFHLSTIWIVLERRIQFYFEEC